MSQSSRALVAARWSVAAIFFIDGAFVGGLAPYFPVIKLSLQLSDGQLGSSLLFSPVGALLTIPTMGGLIGRFGSRNLILVASLALCAVLPFTVAAQTVWQFRVGLLLFGMFNGALDACMNAQSVTIQHRYHRPMLSSTHGCWSLGGFAAAGGVALGTLWGQGPVVHTISVEVLLLIGLAFAWKSLLPHSEDDTGSEPALALPKGPLLLIGVLIMCAFGAEGAAFDWAAVYMRTSLKTTEELAAFGLGVFAAAMSISRLTGDHFVHLLGIRRTLRLGAALSCGGMLLAVVSPSPVVSMIGFGVCGIGMANIVPILFRAAGSVPGFSTGTGIAAVTTCGYGAFLLSPPAIGFLADKFSLSLALGTAGLSILVVGLFGPSALARTNLAKDDQTSAASRHV